jgi:hypothetical protein
MTFQTVLLPDFQSLLLMALSALYALRKSDTMDLLSIGLPTVPTTFNATTS